MADHYVSRGPGDMCLNHVTILELHGQTGFITSVRHSILACAKIEQIHTSLDAKFIHFMFCNHLHSPKSNVTSWVHSKFKNLSTLISSMILITCLWLEQIWVTWFEVLPSHAEISDILPLVGLPRSCFACWSNAQRKAWHYGVPSPQWKCEKCDCGHYNVIHMLGILGCMWSRGTFV